MEKMSTNVCAAIGESGDYFLDFREILDLTRQSKTMHPFKTQSVSSLLLFIQGIQGFNWTHQLKDGKQVKCCEGQTVTFPWKYTLEAEEKLAGISWTKNPGGVNVADKFVNPLKDFKPCGDFANTAKWAENAGLELTGLTTDMSGVFSVTAQRFFPKAGTFAQSVNLTVLPKASCSDTKAVCDPMATGSTHTSCCSYFGCSVFNTCFVLLLFWVMSA